LPPGRPCWIFDPLDGTTNYAHGFPVFASSLALEIDGVIEVGAIYDPTRRELFTATRGGGAYLNGVPMRVSANASLIDGLLVTGFPYSIHEDRGDLVSLFAAFLAEAQAVRRLGSAALDLCYVAAGRADGFWEEILKPWDMHAGRLIIAEAGGRATRLDGTPLGLGSDGIIATNGRIHDELVALVSEPALA
jgi:myo-inositol-1(or 4)-monophosphatase